MAPAPERRTPGRTERWRREARADVVAVGRGREWRGGRSAAPALAAERRRQRGRAGPANVRGARRHPQRRPPPDRGPRLAADPDQSSDEAAVIGSRGLAAEADPSAAERTSPWTRRPTHPKAPVDPSPARERAPPTTTTRCPPSRLPRTAAVTPDRLTYRFGPLERRGILGPVRRGQAAILAVGALLAIVVLDQSPTAGGALVATMLFGGAVAVARRAAGQPNGRGVGADRGRVRAPARRAGAPRFRSRAPVARVAGPRRRRAPARSGSTTRQPAAPGPAGVRIIDANYRDRPIGALSERAGRRLTAVLACRVVAFSLLDAEAQERRLARWGLVLSGAASTPIRRIQWVERTAPAQGDELARWLHAERDPAIPLRGTPMIESYLELIGTTAEVTQEHEILLAVQVDARRVRDRGADAVERALIDETERVAQGLEAAEVTVLGALSSGPARPRAADGVRPVRAGRARRARGRRPGRDGLAEANAWPLGAREAWDHYRSDGAVHATYWIGGWPRVDVSPMFMDALLGRSSAVRTVAVTLRADRARALDPRGRGGGHPRPRRPRAAPPLRPVRDRAPAPGPGRDGPPRVRARGRPRRGPPGRLRHRLRPRPRRAAPGLLRGARARRAGAARAAPPVRAAGRRVHVHAAAVPRAAMSVRAARAARATAARPATPRRSTRSWPPAGSAAAACSSGATRAAGRSATTPGFSTATALLDDPTRSCSASSGRARARWSRRCCGGCCCSAAARSCSTSSASTARCARPSASSRSRSCPVAACA